MTVVELKARKAELVQSILNDVDKEDVLMELSALLNKLTCKEQAPCQYTSEELRTRAEAAIQSYNEQKWVSHEDMKKRFEVYEYSMD